MNSQFVIIDGDGAPEDLPFLFHLLTAPDIHVLGWVLTPSLYPQHQTYGHGVWLQHLTGNPVPLHLGCARGIMGLFPGVLKRETYAPPQTIPVDDMLDGVAFWVKTLNHAQAPVTVVVAGPLTNLALAVVADPTIRRNIKEVVFVGGAVITPGNASPSAEARCFADPHATSVLLSAQIPMVMFPLDLQQTKEAPPTPLIEAWKRTLGQGWAKTLSGKENAVLNSLSAWAYLSKSKHLPPLCQSFTCVETRAGALRGKITVDWFGKLSDPPNVRFLQDKDAPNLGGLGSPAIRSLWDMALQHGRAA